MEKGHFEEPNTDVKKTRKLNFNKIRWDGMDNINMVEDKANGMLVNAATSCHVPKNARTSWNI
jgi:hypothetical protein